MKLIMTNGIVMIYHFQNDISFLEGFHSKDKDNHLIKEAKNKRKEKAKSKGNEGKGPNGEDGYWYTTKTGKHVFVPDD